MAEEHLVDGGLVFAWRKWLLKRSPCVMEFVGIENTYAESGSPEALLEKYGLTSIEIAEAVRRAISRKR